METLEILRRSRSCVDQRLIATVNMNEVKGKDESSMRTTKKEWKIPPPPNPLLIDLILHKLLAMVNKKDLPACRLVCKIWNLKILPRFRREFEVIEGTTCPEMQRKILKKFFRLMRTSTDLPSTNFQMYLLNIRGVRFIHKFFYTWGLDLSHLTLENWTSTNSRRDSFSIKDFDEMIQLSTNLEYLRNHTRWTFKVRSPGLCQQKPEKPQLSAFKIFIFRCHRVSGQRYNRDSNYDDRLLEELRGRTPNARTNVQCNHWIYEPHFKSRLL